jgi:hypothetical protein
MTKDKRYAIVKDAIGSGKISEFGEIFHGSYLPKTVLRKDIAITNERMTLLIEHPEEMSLVEADRISKMINVSVNDIIRIAYKKYFEDRHEEQPSSEFVTTKLNNFRR